MEYDDEADWDLDPVIDQLGLFMKNLFGAMSETTMDSFHADHRNQNLRIPK